VGFSRKGLSALTSSKDDRGDNWIQCFRGGAFWPLDPRPEEIFVEDIAHALSHVCRYGGHCRVFYCVAQHCVEGSYLLDDGTKRGKRLARQFLFHDAAEAYIGDMTRPLKKHKKLLMFRKIEDRIEEAIAERFNLKFPYDPEIKKMDNALLGAEYAAVMTSKAKRGKAAMNKLLDGRIWQFPEPPPVGLVIKPMTSRAAKRAYLKRYRELFE